MLYEDQSNAGLHPASLEFTFWSQDFRKYTFNVTRSLLDGKVDGAEDQITPKPSTAVSPDHEEVEAQNMTQTLAHYKAKVPIIAVDSFLKFPVRVFPSSLRNVYNPNENNYIFQLCIL